VRFGAGKALPISMIEDRQMKPSQSPPESRKPGGLDHIDERDEETPYSWNKLQKRVVRFGQQVGVTPEEMISLLDSGISIRHLLVFLVSRRSGAA
jgi:hypothetical protein